MVAAVAHGCKPEHGGIKQEATEGIWTGGQGGSSADSTEGESQLPLCTDSSAQGLTATKHWCWGEYDIDLTYTISHPLGIPDPAQRGIGLTAVSLANDSTYDDPFAMACCSDITATGWAPGDDTCNLPHHRACHSDVVEHVCEVARTLLAEDKQGLGACSEDAVEGAIGWLESGGYGDPASKGSGEQQCYDFFWLAQGLASTDYCSEPPSFFSKVTWAPGKSFSGCLGSSVVSGLSLTISLYDIHPTAPPAQAQSCTGPEENDGLPPPLGSLPSESIDALAEHPILVDVVGPDYAGDLVVGAGAFGSSSVMSRHPDVAGDLVIDRWHMIGDEPAWVGTPEFSLEATRFGLSLVGPRVARWEAGHFVLEAGEALFHLQGRIDGVGSAIDAVNATGIDLHALAPGHPGCESADGCLVSAPFTIEHVDAFGDAWQLEVGGGHWAR
ncbi:MAG: hypothetical protein KDK70_10440 [Myxococcales bacterium]|nr:hypothetical protein [Myxococcales bacterium]